MSALKLYLKPSSLFLMMILFILIGALMSIFCSHLPYDMELSLAVLALAYGGFVIWDSVLLRSQRAIVCLSYCDDNSWLLQERSGASYAASLVGAGLLGFMGVLHFKCVREGKDLRRTMVVFQEAVDKQAYRRMMMVLGTIRVTKKNDNA